MEQFGWMVQFELKKLVKRKGTWITAVLLIAFQIIFCGLDYFGSAYIDGEFLETHADAIARDAAYARSLSGRSIEELLSEMQEAFSGISEEEKDNFPFYQGKLRPYKEVYQLLNLITESAQEDLMLMDADSYYEKRTERLHQQWTDYKLTEKERAYWEVQEQKLPDSFTYQYANAYEMILLGDIYMAMLLFSFFAAICMGSVFFEEHARKTDQLVICTRLGRNKLYFAKMLAGSIVSMLYALLLFAAVLIIEFAIYGTDGFGALFQIYAPLSSENISIGGFVVAATCVLLIAALMTGVFTMVLSEMIHNNIGTMAIVIVIVFLAKLIVIPWRYRILGQIWNYLPVNILSAGGLLDMRLLPVPIVGYLSAWQTAPVLYLLLTLLFLWICRRVYLANQVSGR